MMDQVNDLAALEGEDTGFKQSQNDYIVADDHRRPSRFIDPSVLMQLKSNHQYEEESKLQSRHRNSILQYVPPVKET